MTDELITEKFDNLKQAFIDVKETIEDYIKGDKRDTEDFKEKHSEEHKKVWVEISVLKVKAGVWGMLGGLIPIITALIIYIFTSGILGKH